jgi:1-deoxy-D-xylulose-5-phosphate synthase
LREAIAIDDAPTVVRFPKGSVAPELDALRRSEDGVDVLAEAAHKDVLIVAVGPMAHVALEVRDRLADQGIGATVIDPRWVVPVAPSIITMARAHRIVISIEDGIRVGGVGTRIRQELRAAGVDTAVDEIGLPDEFLDHAERAEILTAVGLTSQTIARNVVAQVLGMKVPVARPLPVENTTEASLDARSDSEGAR